jgi:hypothetical protein
MTAKLKPCCANPDIHFSSTLSGWIDVYCVNCRASLTSVEYGRTRAEAIAAWNRRAPRRKK